MAILLKKDHKVIVQGMTGRDGTFHSERMLQYNTNLVGGVTPGKGGITHIEKPVFNTVREAVEDTGANTSIIFVPAFAAADGIMEAADAGIQLIVCITEGIPTQDMIRSYEFVKQKGVNLIGPNTPGIITPGVGKVGIMPADVHLEGRVGVISRSGTLTYEAVAQLTALGLGQSTCMGLGGDPIIGTRHLDAIKMFDEDPDTEAVVMIGEIGGTDEEMAADYISDNIDMPIVAFIAGKTAPKGKRMGHAGAIIAGGKGTAAEKEEALKAAGVHVAESPADIGKLMKEALGK